jgi:AraC-like DNA-binding protein
MSVFAPSVSGLWRQIEGYGINPAPLFKKYGVQALPPFDPNTRLSSTKLDLLRNDVADQTGDRFFGLREAEYILPSHIGALGFAWLASTSLRSAMERLQRYIQVIHEKTEITLKEDSTALIVGIHSEATTSNDYHGDSGNLAVLTRMCRFIVGEDWNPDRVTLAHPAPADTSYYFQYFRCPIEFNAEHHSIHIDRQQADQHLTGSNKQLAQLNDHMVVRYLASQSRGDIVSQVKTAILENLGEGGICESIVAESLHMSTRNLHRKLNSVNTSFKTLLLETRSELANQYINDASLTLTEISYMLGFSEISSFSRAYKRWTGQSPSAARKSQSDSPA